MIVSKEFKINPTEEQIKLIDKAMYGMEQAHNFYRDLYAFNKDKPEKEKKKIPSCTEYRNSNNFTDISSAAFSSVAREGFISGMTGRNCHKENSIMIYQTSNTLKFKDSKNDNKEPVYKDLIINIPKVGKVLIDREDRAEAKRFTPYVSKSIYIYKKEDEYFIKLNFNVTIDFNLKELMSKAEKIGHNYRLIDGDKKILLYNMDSIFYDTEFPEELSDFTNKYILACDEYMKHANINKMSVRTKELINNSNEEKEDGDNSDIRKAIKAITVVRKTLINNTLINIFSDYDEIYIYNEKIKNKYNINMDKYITKSLYAKSISGIMNKLGLSKKINICFD